MKTTHIVSTDLRRSVDRIAEDFVKSGAKVTQILRTTGNIFLYIPKNINAMGLKNIEGVVAVSPNYTIKRS
jgi:hypothetical protein